MATQLTMALRDKENGDVLPLNAYQIGIVEGLLDLKNDVVEQDTAISDGSFFQGVFQQPRQIIMPIVIVRENRESYLNAYKNLKRFLIRQKQLELVIQQLHPLDPERQFAKIDVAVVDFTKQFINAKMYSSFNLEFLASNPLYEIIPRRVYSTPTLGKSNGYGHSKQLSPTVGKFYNRYYKVFENGNSIFIDNDGETLADVIMTFKNSTQATTTFTITNQTRNLPGATLSFLFNLQTDEELIFETQSGKLVIRNINTLVEVNAYDKKTNGNAQDFRLAIGTNSFTWNASSSDFMIDFEVIEYLRNL